MLIGSGMSAKEAGEILGKPCASVQLKEGTLWRYTLYYSSLLEVYFDSSGKVQKVFPPQLE